MGFTSPPPPPPPEKVAAGLWQLSVTLKTGSAPDVATFAALPAEEQAHWVALADVAIVMILSAMTPPTNPTA